MDMRRVAVVLGSALFLIGGYVQAQVRSNENRIRILPHQTLDYRLALDRVGFIAGFRATEQCLNLVDRGSQNRRGQLSDRMSVPFWRGADERNLSKPDHLSR